MEGYPQLAELQGRYPELAIYRRFATLNARNLLYLQAEIVDLEVQLQQYTIEDTNSDDAEKKIYARNWSYLSQPTEGGVDNSQWHTALRIREKLKEYNEDECLIQQRHLFAFDDPDPSNLAFLQEWLSDSARGNYALEGLDRNVWDSSDDLLVAMPDHLRDSFTRLIARCFDAYHHLVGSRRKASDVENGLWKYEDKQIVRVSDIAGTLISSILAVVAVVVLYCVKNMLKRLGLVAVFTVLFSLALVVVTKAKRIEIFAATAAFASVQVVFVGSTST